MSLSIDREDGTLLSTSESGYVQSRYRYTRPMRRKWSIGYEALLSNDALLLTNFIDTVRGGTDIFLWPHPITGQYPVRFEKAPVIKLMEGLYDGGYRYSTDFNLIEV